MSYLVDHRVRGAWTSEGADAAHLPDKALEWLADRVGPLGPPAPLAPDSALVVPESVLPAAARAELIGELGEDHLLTGPGERLGRSGGLSYLDLLRRRSVGSAATHDLAVPDAVALPGSAEVVQRVLDICVRHDVAVVPFGGGTSVVGGVTAARGGKSAVLALDLLRLDSLVAIDPISRIAVFGAGVRGPEAERMLAEHGLTLGHVPQSFERATIGGYAATRSAGQQSSGYGRFEDMVAGVRLATPQGEWKLGVAPASAAGPDLREVAVGSEGALGVITEVALRVRPQERASRFEGLVLDGWENASRAVRTLAQAGILPDVTRLSDMDETAVSLALSGGAKTAALRGFLAARGVKQPCVLILGWYGQSEREISLRRKGVMRLLGGSGAIRLGRMLGDAWRRGRFAGPRQRDALIDNGVCVETLETATYWSTLSQLRDEVRAAVSGALRSGSHEPVVMCHISHAYETGASLYFTVLAARDADDPAQQWRRAKRAACQAITAPSGRGGRPLGTITHHHAVGTDHAPYLEREIGRIGVSVLAAAKDAADPTGILNPGKLIPR